MGGWSRADEPVAHLLESTHEALPLLQEAQQLTVQSPRIAVGSQRQGEVYAHLGDSEACDAALNIARTLASQASVGEDRYATGFNPSRLAGYEGACFVRLRQPERALPALQQALALLDPQAIRRQSTLFTDIGIAHAQQGNRATCLSICDPGAGYHHADQIPERPGACAPGAYGVGDVEGNAGGQRSGEAT